MGNQKIITIGDNYEEIDLFIRNTAPKRILLVCGQAIQYFRINQYFQKLEKQTGIEVVRFNNFRPNPLYEAVVEGVHLFNEKKCDLIIAVGGGSSIDVAKCIKLYCNMDHTKNYLFQPIIPNDIPLLAVPTTAGSGSEATRFAVLYYQGEKQSISDISCIPSVVFWDESVLSTLPLYQKKATILDALCHAIESYWSINSTELSRQYSLEAIGIIIHNMDRYLGGDTSVNMEMLKAAHIAGKAINIAQTTAGHAMCYKLTSLYDFAHGHAASLCMVQLFETMINNLDKCIDSRGSKYLENIFYNISVALGGRSIEDGVHKLRDIVRNMEFENIVPKEQDYDLLVKSVNPVRLKNNPVKLDSSMMDYMYHKIFEMNR